MAGDMLQNGLDDGSAADGAERREFPRFTVKLRVLVAVGNVILPGRAENLSKGGACLRLEEMLPVGTPIAVRLLTPYLTQFKNIDVNGTVQYVSLTSGTPPCRTGVKFAGMDREAKRRLAMLIGE